MAPGRLKFFVFLADILLPPPAVQNWGHEWRVVELDPKVTRDLPSRVHTSCTSWSAQFGKIAAILLVCLLAKKASDRANGLLRDLSSETSHTTARHHPGADGDDGCLWPSPDFRVFDILSAAHASQNLPSDKSELPIDFQIYPPCTICSILPLSPSALAVHQPDVGGVRSTLFSNADMWHLATQRKVKSHGNGGRIPRVTYHRLWIVSGGNIPTDSSIS